MTDTVDTRPVQLAALSALPADEPVVMINLLKFNQGGGHEQLSAVRAGGGRYLQKVGASVRYGRYGTGLTSSETAKSLGGTRSWWWSIRRLRRSSTW